MMIQYQLNEIKMYINRQYIGAPKAMWYIFHFAIHEQFPPVVHLQIISMFLSDMTNTEHRFTYLTSTW